MRFIQTTAGNIYCSLEDFAKFVALQFPHKRPAILNREQLDESLIPIPGNYGGAAGWVVFYRPEENREVLWLFAQGDGGLCCGFFVVIETVPSRGHAYIAAANSHDDGELYSSETVSMLYSIIDSLRDPILP